MPSIAGRVVITSPYTQKDHFNRKTNLSQFYSIWFYNYINLNFNLLEAKIPQNLTQVSCIFPSRLDLKQHYGSCLLHILGLIYSTLPSVETPYPMLVLVGPQGAGKKDLAQKLVEEFSDYFGYG